MVKALVPNNRAEQAVDFGGAFAGCGHRGEACRWRGDHAGVGARVGRIVMVRLEHRDVEEVGAVLPDVEMRERVDLLRGGGVDAAIGRIDRVHTGVGALRYPGEADAVIDQNEPGKIRRLLHGLDRQVRSSGEPGGSKRRQ